MHFEWDIYKAVANWLKHRVSFGQAVTALDDPSALITLSMSAGGEIRFKLIGEVSESVRSDSASIVVVVYTKRDKDITRIISVRPANIKERNSYEQRR